MRIALGIEYDGTTFAGWQWQPARRTIQTVLENALSRIADEPVRVHAAGRTDAGVHAIEQVAHFDTRADRSLRGWLLGCNTELPEDIRVLWVKEVPPDFHARYCAIARYYRYVILNRPMKSALLKRQVTWCFQPLDECRMQRAASCLVGEHDFSSFRAQGCQSSSPYRNLHFIAVQRDGDRVIVELAANAFLHHMVRNIIGVLMTIGSGKREAAWAAEVLAARNRSVGGVTALPDGLYLGGVLYPDCFQLPRNPIFSRLPRDAARFSPRLFDDDVSLAANSR